jgi:hypothetical protein
MNFPPPRQTGYPTLQKNLAENLRLIQYWNDRAIAALSDPDKGKSKRFIIKAQFYQNRAKYVEKAIAEIEQRYAKRQA